ncbi:hypothetical protein NYO91_18570, partial [Arhodomonas aquaeolei]|uniref:hypothetical protein n=1 Tax=Arhodomonas aquaeolei TaxID=2369 RepID=UPI00216909C3
MLILDRFPNGLDPSLDGDWRRIDGFFDTLARPPAAVATLMDHYVHDAIAGFLADDRTEVIGHLKDLVRYKQLLDGDERFALNARRLGISLSDEE